MKAVPGALRVATVGPSLALILCLAACGGGGSDASRVVVLEVHSADARDALLLSAAQEHGAPGENEPVRYRVRASEPDAAKAAIAALRANGFSDVEME